MKRPRRIKIVVGTRGSQLALTQTQLVVQGLEARWADLKFEVKVIKTRGDDSKTAITDIRAGRKGLFTGEIERTLVTDNIDLAVHSAKDLPSNLAPGTEIAAVLPRAIVDDVLVATTQCDLNSLAADGIVATGSVRRKHQLRWKRPDLEIVDLRGNVPTRLRKLATDRWHGMILAQAEYGAAIDKSVFPGCQGGPLVHVMAGKAVCFQEALQPGFKQYAAQIVSNAKALAASLAEAGYRMISGGTDTHLMLVDVFSKGMFGSEAEKALGLAGITVNKNAIPFDTNPPLKPSGIRLGTPALTTRGMKEAEMKQIAGWIAAGLEQRNDAAALKKIRAEVFELCERFPLYPERRRVHEPETLHA